MELSSEDNVSRLAFNSSKPKDETEYLFPHMLARTMVSVGIEELEEEVLPVMRWNRAAAASAASDSRALPPEPPEPLSPE